MSSRLLAVSSSSRSAAPSLPLCILHCALHTPRRWPIRHSAFSIQHYTSPRPTSSIASIRSIASIGRRAGKPAPDSGPTTTGRRDDGLTRRQDCASRRFAEARPDCSSPRLLVVSSSSKAAPSPIVHCAFCIVHCALHVAAPAAHSAFSIQHCPAANRFVDFVDLVLRGRCGRKREASPLILRRESAKALVGTSREARSTHTPATDRHKKFRKFRRTMFAKGVNLSPAPALRPPVRSGSRLRIGATAGSTAPRRPRRANRKAQEARGGLRAGSEERRRDRP